MRIVYVDGFKIRNLTGDMGFNVLHGPKISWYSPWFIPEGELWIERLVKDETKSLIKAEFLEKKLYEKTGDYWMARRKIAKMLCKKSGKNCVLKKFKKRDLTVRVVDGGIVRQTLDPSFVAGGHGLIYPWYIPKNEIWLDGKLDSRELKYILAHEELEYRLMKKGQGYNKAHEAACVVEKELRAENGISHYPKINPTEPLPFIQIRGGRKKVLITSGIHGDEPSGPYAIAKFLLKEKLLQKIKQKLSADIIPLINPEGFRRRKRKNGKNQDINRYFFDKSRKNEPKEAKTLKKFFRNVKEPYDLMISLHEDPGRKNFYLYDTQNGKNSEIVENIFRVVKKHGIRLYTGLDSQAWKNKIQNGYVEVKPKSGLPTLEECLSRNGKVKKALTLEIPGRFVLDKKINLVIEILETILLKP